MINRIVPGATERAGRKVIGATTRPFPGLIGGRWAGEGKESEETDGLLFALEFSVYVVKQRKFAEVHIYIHIQSYFEKISHVFLDFLEKSSKKFAYHILVFSKKIDLFLISA